MLFACADFERATIVERLRAGIATAKSCGTHCGAGVSKTGRKVVRAGLASQQEPRNQNCSAATVRLEAKAAFRAVWDAHE